MHTHESPQHTVMTNLMTHSKLQHLRQQCLDQCIDLRNAIARAQTREDFLSALERAEAFLLILQHSTAIESD